MDRAICWPRTWAELCRVSLGSSLDNTPESTRKRYQMTKPKIDFSIMPSLQCNLQCSFCMYDAGPDNTLELDYDKTAAFLSTFDWDLISQFGFYGGEPFMDLPLYQKFIDLVPKGIPRFIISNGTWSRDYNDMTAFVEFLCKNRFYLIVSGTEEHTPYQNRKVLELLSKNRGSAMRIKGADVIHAMGRASGLVNTCEGFCQLDDRPMRLAIHPSGNVIFQNCHGEYPVVQSIDEPFEDIYYRAVQVSISCYKQKTKEPNHAISKRQ